MSFTDTLLSYALFAAVPLMLLVMLTMLPIRSWRARLPVYSIALIIAVIMIAVFRPGDSSVASSDEAENLLASGQPVFVEFFSNRCPPCIASEPIVRSLSTEVGEDVHVLRLNVQDSISLPLMREYSAFSTPTFIVVNGAGDEIWRQTGSILDKDAALEALGTG